MSKICRPCVCGHLKSEHVYRPWFNDVQVVNCKVCELCSEYWPIDNLEYLEWAYKRKVDKNKKRGKTVIKY